MALNARTNNTNGSARAQSDYHYHRTNCMPGAQTQQ